MSYISAVDHLYALGHELAHAAPGAPRRKFDLAHMRALMAALGDPQKSFPSVLIAGTNGKGSTAATLASILAAAGYRVALYTSPHLIRVNERIRIDGVQISDEDFARLYFRVDDAANRLVAARELPHHPSFFEVLTALAFLYYAEQKIDIAVLEVGLGGRLDATNIVDPLLSIITDIALDHQEYLGNTIAAITREKAGILRPGGLLITLPQHPEANQTIGEVAATLGLTAISAAGFIPPTRFAAPQIEAENALHLPRNRYTVTVDEELLEVDSPLRGQHQQRNIALSIAAAVALRSLNSYKLDIAGNRSSYKITNANIEAGIRGTRWPGRLELLPSTPPLLLDVAHNPAGAWTLRAAIAELPPARPRTLIFSCLRDKSVREMTQILLPLFDATGGDPERARDHIVLAPIDNPRAATLEELQAAARALDIPAVAAPTLADALAQARALTSVDGIILATGSIYLVGEIRRLALSDGADPA
ncbi:MAG: bifunctional folylpolyglutamate synthase/ dihydrofolate synthase [Acidobacteriales bacterium 59-55]|nr:bifunctional folylpolyglutamate synthase/dihydrofolate synthase [Terriglobales bacterium]ODU54846.1 MAG: bifunctional folylpolyglutamate synthase/ dihydrofolate synthase [Granulicella sp. SCN 62-9]OJV44177.1 MAG: bifunctional folylpolyglutamate synthase/ dihydrofolate synthase [Acidobacteriales bacterium 59-55]